MEINEGSNELNLVVSDLFETLLDYFRKKKNTKYKYSNKPFPGSSGPNRDFYLMKVSIKLVLNEVSCTGVTL